MSDEKRITVRVSNKLYEKVAAAAKERNLSINAFVIYALEDSTFEGLEVALANLQKQIDQLGSKIAQEPTIPGSYSKTTKITPVE